MLAEKAGVARPTLNAILNGLRTPREATFLAICDAIGVEPDEILRPARSVAELIGDHLPSHDEVTRSPLAYLAGSGLDNLEPVETSDLVLVRRYDVVASAGGGLIPVSEDSESMAFPRAWLAQVNVPADKAALVAIKGDSMAPTIPDGSTALLHRSAEMIGEGIYVFSRDGGVSVKRIKRIDTTGKVPASLAIMSDNPSYPPEMLSGEEMNALRLIGRVRWVIAPI